MTPARTVALLLTLACLHPRTAAGWPEVQYLDHPGDLTWFVAFSDTHVGASDLLYGSKDLVRLGWATTELVSVVEPAFVVNAGDLTDASGLGPIPTGQIETEWIEYAETLAAGGMDAAFYHDLPGNHDHYGDGDLSHYRTWSVSGASDDQVNHAWTFTTPATGYLALGLATCASDGQPSPFDNAGLDEVDRAFVTDTMAQHPAEPLVVVFGHHPVSALDEGRDFLEELLSQDRVGLYLYGHTHDYAVFWDLGALHVNVRSLTKNDNLHVALVALDGRGLSLRVFDEGDWPQVLITAPLDRDLGGGNATAAPIPWHLTAAPLRALAFDPSGVAAVEWNVDGSPWSPMGEAGEHIWQGTFDASVLSEYPHTFQVRATAADGGTANHSISILVDPDAVPPDPPEPSPEVAEPSPEVAEPPPDVVEDSSFPDPAPDSSPDVPASEDVALTGDVDVAFVDGLVFVDGRAGDTDIADVSGPPIHPSSDGAASGSCGAGRAPVRFIPAAALLLLFLPAALRRRPRFSGIRRDP